MEQISNVYFTSPSMFLSYRFPFHTGVQFIRVWQRGRFAWQISCSRLGKVFVSCSTLTAVYWFTPFDGGNLCKWNIIAIIKETVKWVTGKIAGNIGLDSIVFLAYTYIKLLKLHFILKGTTLTSQWCNNKKLNKIDLCNLVLNT